MHPTPPTDDRESLDFDAFLYVTGELDPRLIAPFERRLTEDSKAQQAVTRAVMLLESVALAEAECASHVQLSGPSNRTAWRTGWRSVVAALASVAALLAAAKLLPHHSPAASPTRMESSTAQLALAWAETYPILNDELDLSAGLHDVIDNDPGAAIWSASSSEQAASWSPDSLVSDDGWIEAAVQSMARDEKNSASEREEN